MRQFSACMLLDGVTSSSCAVRCCCLLHWVTVYMAGCACAFLVRPAALNSAQSPVELSLAAVHMWRIYIGQADVVYKAVSGVLALPAETGALLLQVCMLLAWCLCRVANGFERTTHGRAQSVRRGQLLHALCAWLLWADAAAYICILALSGVSAGHAAAAAIAIHAVRGQKAPGLHMAWHTNGFLGSCMAAAEAATQCEEMFAVALCWFWLAGNMLYLSAGACRGLRMAALGRSTETCLLVH